MGGPQLTFNEENHTFRTVLVERGWLALMSVVAFGTNYVGLVEDARPSLGRPCAHAKFLFVGDRKLYVRGVTYGTFKPDEDGDEYPAHEVVRRDFAQMLANGINAVRTYTPPPTWFLDLAARSGLYVMVGLALERYVGYLIDTKDAPDLVAQARARVRANAGHSAILCYSIANEIPAPTVRWLGRKRVERFLRRI